MRRGVLVIAVAAAWLTVGAGPAAAQSSCVPDSGGSFQCAAGPVACERTVTPATADTWNTTVASCGIPGAANCTVDDSNRAPYTNEAHRCRVGPEGGVGVTCTHDLEGSQYFTAFDDRCSVTDPNGAALATCHRYQNQDGVYDHSGWQCATGSAGAGCDRSVATVYVDPPSDIEYCTVSYDSTYCTVALVPIDTPAGPVQVIDPADSTCTPGSALQRSRK